MTNRDKGFFLLVAGYVTITLADNPHATFAGITLGLLSGAYFILSPKEHR